MDEFVKLFFEKHGVCYPSQMIDHLEKKEKTCLQKYGFKHSTQNPEIQEKIIQHLGADCYHADGSLNKAFFSQLILSMILR